MNSPINLQIGSCLNNLLFSYHVSIAYVTGPAKIDHVSTKKSPILCVFAVS